MEVCFDLICQRITDVLVLNEDWIMQNANFIVGDIYLEEIAKIVNPQRLTECQREKIYIFAMNTVNLIRSYRFMHPDESKERVHELIGVFVHGQFDDCDLLGQMFT